MLHLELFQLVEPSQEIVDKTFKVKESRETCN